jgi:hypothetical protein
MENKEAADRAAVVWKAILEKQAVKIELEREKVEAAKMGSHAAAVWKVEPYLAKELCTKMSGLMTLHLPQDI